jgi:hypothetical protein
MFRIALSMLRGELSDGLCENWHMRRRKRSSPISDVLRRAIIASGETYYAIEVATGVSRANIWRFAKGGQSILLDAAERLAEHFGLELRTRGGEAAQRPPA